jgi:hypothetical protein
MPVAARVRILVLGWATAGLLAAQTTSTPALPAVEDTPQAVPLAGPQIVSASAFGSYYSSSVPETTTFIRGNSSSLPSDFGGGGSIVFDWSKFTQRTTFSVSYSPSYSAQVRYSSLDALNHAFSMNISHKLTPLWTLGFSVAANYSTLEESLFTSSSLSNVASVNASSSQFSSALLSGNSTGNPQLGVALTNSTTLESPVATLLYGQHIFSSSGRTTLSHWFSPRLSVTFTGGAARTQYLSQNQPTVAGTTPLLLANTTSGTGSAALEYSLSPVTEVGGTVTSTWVTSSLENANISTAMATIGRILGKKWTVQAHGGIGINKPIGQSYYAIQSSASPVGGGSVGFKSGSSTLLGSFDYSVADTYGAGASSTSTVNVAWLWKRPGSFWSVQTNLSWQRLAGSTSSYNTSGWKAAAGLNRVLGPHFSMLWQYTYLEYSGGLTGSAYSLSESAVRISMVWTPQPNTLR